jgi:hypothetical protein
MFRPPLIGAFMMEKSTYMSSREVSSFTRNNIRFLILNQGDSCYFDSTMRHAFVSISDGDAVILSICLSINLFRKEN